MSATAVPFIDRDLALAFVRYVAKKKAIVYTDESKVYDDLANHETVRHSVGEYVRDQAHTNGIESFWSMLKRGHMGTYHKMIVKHVQRYV